MTRQDETSALIENMVLTMPEGVGLMGGGGGGGGVGGGGVEAVASATWARVLVLVT